MSYAKARITGNGITIPLNVNLVPGQSFYSWLNVKETLSAVGTRHTETAKQADHGVEDSLSHYNSRFMPFEGEIHATSVSERITMEQELRQCLALKRSQSQTGDDGYILLEIEDEDGVDKQIYAKVVDMPEFTRIADGQSARSKFRFSMIANDPFLYAQESTSIEGPETSYSTFFTLQDGSLLSLQDGDLPSLQERISGLTVDNVGTIGSSPVLVVNGPTADPVIRNNTTGKTMELTGLTLLADERVEIDVSSYTITKFDSSDIETDASAFLTTESDWIFIEAGENRLSLTDSTPGALTATIEVEFRSCWI